jgi:hypothetical protein
MDETTTLCSHTIKAAFFIQLQQLRALSFIDIERIVLDSHELLNQEHLEVAHNFASHNNGHRDCRIFLENAFSNNDGNNIRSKLANRDPYLLQTTAEKNGITSMVERKCAIIRYVVARRAT